ncbi:hypothetical protein ACFLW3_01280 [Chloroflexota bacterium]
MLRKKRFFVIPLILAVMVFGNTGGIALADEGTQETPRTTFVEMVAELLDITSEELQSVFCDAREQMQELDPEERNAEQFKDILEEILYTEYGVEYRSLETAITDAKEAMKEQHRERLEARKGEIQQQLEARRAQIRERLEAHKAEQEEWLEARKAQIRERLEAHKAELQAWFESFKGDPRARIEAWRNRMQEWREAQKGELQGRIETWQNRVQEWRETHGNDNSNGTAGNVNGQGQNN